MEERSAESGPAVEPAGDHPGGHPGADRGPLLPFRRLDTLWLQVTGTVCNIACRHCFISCGPKNLSHGMMTLEQVDAAIRDAEEVGVREFYFTGGEPFLHPQIFELIERTLRSGPLSILTNGILIDAAAALRLRQIFDSADYNLDLRVSLDGTTPGENDPIRGKGTFDKILAGLRCLADAGLNPVLTVTEVLEATEATRVAFVELLRSIGLGRPRIKFLAPFRIGRESRRSAGYAEHERLREGDLLPGEEETLQCSSSRMVTERGVWPCPILIEVPAARMGDRLADGLVAIRLDHPACHTCHTAGISCRT